MQDVITEYFRVHLLTTENLTILGFTWGMIEFLSVFVYAGIKQLRKTKQVIWWGRQKLGKQAASTVWCSIAVWIPGARPDETAFHRVAMGLMLGIVLTLIHKYGISLLKKKLAGLLGLKKLEPDEVTRTKR